MSRRATAQPTTNPQAPPINGDNGNGGRVDDGADGFRRWTADDRCVICGGTHTDPKGQGVRCYGGRTSSPNVVYCSRDDWAGPLKPSGKALNCYRHVLKGTCGCGISHEDEVAPTDGVTLEAMAKKTKLSAGLIMKFGVTQIDKYRATKAPALAIPYFDELGIDVAYHFRIRMSTEPRFHWRKKDRPILYGLTSIPIACEKGSITIVEGESDVWTLAHHGLPAVGLPGAGVWQDAWAAHFPAEIKKIFVVIEVKEDGTPDDGGKRVLDWLALSPIGERAHLIFLSKWKVKDPNALHVLDPDQFKARWLEAIESAIPWREQYDRALAERRAQWKEAQAEQVADLEKQARVILVEATDPIIEIMNTWSKLGWGGDEKLPTLTYVQATTRLLVKRPEAPPAHGQLIGPPSSGKSFVMDLVRSTLPEEAYVMYDAGSLRVIINDPVPIQHKVIFWSEIDSIPGIVENEENPAASFIRTLLQRGDATYKVSVRDPDVGGWTVQEIEKEGPACLISSGVELVKGAQLQSRLLAVEVPEDEKQIKAALDAHALAELRGPSPKVNPALVAMQRLFQGRAPYDVVFPHVRALDNLLARKRIDSRLLRDAGRILALVKGVAILRSAKRETRDGRLVATDEDYRTVVDLIEDHYEVTASVSQKMRDLWLALPAPGEGTISQTELATRLKISQPAVSKRLPKALNEGFVRNGELEFHPGSPQKLFRGPEPPSKCGLPSVDELQAWKAERKPV